MTGMPSAQAAVGEPADRLGELPHHGRVLGRAEVQAVGDRQRTRAGRGDVAVRLGQRQLRARVRVQPGVAAVAVGGDRDPAQSSTRPAGSCRRPRAAPATVLPRTKRSYWSVTQELSARLGEATICSSGRAQFVAGPRSGEPAAVVGLSASWPSGRAYGRS